MESLVLATVSVLNDERYLVSLLLIDREYRVQRGCCSSRHQSASQSVREGSRISAISRSSTTGAGFCWDCYCSTRQRMYSGAGFPDAAFTSPIFVRVIFSLSRGDAKTSGKDYSMAICRQPELACMQFFFPYADRFSWPDCLCVNLAGNLKWLDSRV